MGRQHNSTRQRGDLRPERVTARLRHRIGAPEMPGPSSKSESLHLSGFEFFLLDQNGIQALSRFGEVVSFLFLAGMTSSTGIRFSI